MNTVQERASEDVSKLQALAKLGGHTKPLPQWYKTYLKACKESMYDGEDYLFDNVGVVQDIDLDTISRYPCFYTKQTYAFILHIAKDYNNLRTKPGYKKFQEEYRQRLLDSGKYRPAWVENHVKMYN